MKIYLITLFLLSSLFSQAQTDFLIRVRDPIFKSVIITQEKTIPQVKVKPDQTVQYHLLSGQNILFAALTVDAPLDTTKKWIFKITAVEDTGVVPTEPILKETLNDNSTRVIYTGTWVKFTNQTWTTSFLNNDVSVTSVVNSAATVTFTGKKVIVTAELRENHGFAKIEVKQGTTIIDTKLVDMYSATAINAPAQIYSSATLPQGTYTVTVSLNSISTGRDSMVLDSFLIFE